MARATCVGRKVLRIPVKWFTPAVNKCYCVVTDILSTPTFLALDSKCDFNQVFHTTVLQILFSWYLRSSLQIGFFVLWISR